MRERATHYCAICKATLNPDKRKRGSGQRLIALIAQHGAVSLRRLAIEVYGYDSSETRRRAGYALKRYRDRVEPVGDSKWRLVAKAEAAE